MKKHIVITMLLIISVASFSQPVTDPAPTVKTDYLKKSSNQKFAAWVLLGGGAIVLTIYGLSNVGLDFADPNNSSSAVPVGIAAVCMASSIPFFIASAKNKHKAKAMSASIRMENTDVILGYSMVHTSYPALSLKITLH